MNVAVLYELALATGRASSVDEVLDAALAAVCEALHVDRASILLFDEAGAMRFRAWRGLSDEYRAAVDGHSPWTRDDVDPRPIAIADAETSDAMDPYRAIFRVEGIRSLAFVPLVHERRLLGKFMIYGGAPRELTEEDLRFATTVAAQIAQAVARQSAEDFVRRARDAAEDAARVRQELLATFAHDLRNPLGVVQLKAQVMQRRLPAGEAGAQARKDLAMIVRSAEQMACILRDLVDVSTIQSGRLELDAEPLAIADVVREAVERTRSLAAPRGLVLSVLSRVDGERVVGDRLRVGQVLANILGNAVKFSPDGGTITIETHADDEEVAFVVADQGPGIDRAEREAAFEAFKAAARGAGAGRERGAGLGLYIARGFVTAHGGRIWIDDSAPTGARVAFTLPRA